MWSRTSSRAKTILVAHFWEHSNHFLSITAQGLQPLMKHMRLAARKIKCRKYPGCMVSAIQFPSCKSEEQRHSVGVAHSHIRRVLVSSVRTISMESALPPAQKKSRDQLCPTPTPLTLGKLLMRARSWSLLSGRPTCTVVLHAKYPA